MAGPAATAPGEVAGPAAASKPGSVSGDATPGEVATHPRWGCRADRGAAVAWLIRDGQVLASIGVDGVAVGRRRVVRGPGLEAAWCRAVPPEPPAAVRGPAGLDQPAGVLVEVRRVTRHPRAWSWRPGWPAATVVVAPLGCFERWSLRPGDRLEVRATAAPGGPGAPGGAP